MTLSDIGHATNGALSITGGLLVAQPLFTLKTYLMLGKGFPPLHRLWSGYFVNVACSAPAEAIAFFSYHLFEKTVHRANEDLTTLQNFSASTLAGVISSPINAAFEQVMIKQQLHGGSMVEHIKSIYERSGWKGIFRGSLPTAGRDAIFTCGLFALNDAVNAKMEGLVLHKFTRDTLSSVFSGAVAGFLSTPLDLGKTIIQQQGTGTSFQVLKQIVQNEGITSIFRGAFSRSATTGTLICAMAYLKDNIPHLSSDQSCS